MKKRNTSEEHIHHIRRLKHHRNSLYLIVLILLVLQIISFATISSQFAIITSSQDDLKKHIGRSVTELQDGIDTARAESQFGIQSIAQEVAQQKKDVQKDISLLKASQSDFSEIIDDVIKGVVTIGTDKSTGSGFIVSNDGYIVTNQHTLVDASFVKVQTSDGSILDATIVASDSFADIALLKIQGNFYKLELGDSDAVQVGEKVIAIGNPLGLSFTVTEGIVSAVDRTGPNGLAEYIQTDVTLNPGNSGGPLINKEGKIIGINNFKIGNAESLGFALESNLVKEKIAVLSQNTLSL